MWFYKVLAAQDVKDGAGKRSRMPSEYYEHYDQLMATELWSAKEELRGDSEKELAYNSDVEPEAPKQ